MDNSSNAHERKKKESTLKKSMTRKVIITHPHTNPQKLGRQTPLASPEGINPFSLVEITLHVPTTTPAALRIWNFIIVFSGRSRKERLKNEGGFQVG